MLYEASNLEVGSQCFFVASPGLVVPPPEIAGLNKGLLTIGFP